MFSQFRFTTIFSFLIFWQALSLVIGTKSFPSVVDIVLNFFNLLK